MAKFSAFVFLTWFISSIVVDSTQLPPTKDKKPHIILIVADDLGFNDVPWHNKEVVAPNMQRLADEGIILEQSYVQPICTPTRSALMTGKYPFTLGRQGGVIRPLMPTGLSLKSSIIPQLLKPLGYSTHAIGKWHLGFCKWQYTPTERGFDTFHGYYLGSEDYYSHMRSYGNKKKRNSDDKIQDGYDFRNNRDVYLNASGHYSTYEFATRAEELLREIDPSVPKFIYMAFQSVHSPLEVPENYTKPYLHIKDRNRRIYLGMVTAMDEAIGRIVTALKETNHYEDSIIIFTTDNGGPTSAGANNWPLRGNKTTLWEGGTRGAAFVHSPRIPNIGTVSNNLVHVTDWMSTIVNLAGGSLPNNTDSIDQWPALISNLPPPRDEFVYDIVGKLDNKDKKLKAGIRLGYYKLIIGNPGPGDWTPSPTISEEKQSEKQRFSKMTFKDHYDMIIKMKESCYQKLSSSYKHQLRQSNISNSMKKAVKKLLRTELRKTRPKREIRQTDLDAKDTKFVQQLFSSKSFTVRLYNLRNDPQERVNLYPKYENIAIRLGKRLVSYKPRYVNPDTPAEDPKGEPKHWKGVWSPGWC